MREGFMHITSHRIKFIMWCKYRIMLRVKSVSIILQVNIWRIWEEKSIAQWRNQLIMHYVKWKLENSRVSIDWSHVATDCRDTILEEKLILLMQQSIICELCKTNLGKLKSFNWLIHARNWLLHGRNSSTFKHEIDCLEQAIDCIYEV